MATPSSHLLLLILAAHLLASTASALEFRVGGPRGWIEPTGHESETYNHWAGRNRFHVGDSLHFKYVNDSVLVVDYEGYAQCNTTSPLLEFNDGNTTLQFERYGFFYFISGDAGHCKSGQKLVVRVMVHTGFDVAASPGPAPFAQQGGGWNPGAGSGSGRSGTTTSGGNLKARVGSAVAGAGVMGLLIAFMSL